MIERLTNYQIVIHFIEQSVLMMNTAITFVNPQSLEAIIPSISCLKFLLWTPHEDLLSSLSKHADDVQSFFPSPSTISDLPTTSHLIFEMVTYLHANGFSKQALCLLGWLRIVIRLYYPSEALPKYCLAILVRTHYTAYSILREGGWVTEASSLHTHPSAASYLEYLRDVIHHKIGLPELLRLQTNKQGAPTSLVMEDFHSELEVEGYMLSIIASQMISVGVFDLSRAITSSSSLPTPNARLIFLLVREYLHRGCFEEALALLLESTDTIISNGGISDLADGLELTRLAYSNLRQYEEALTMSQSTYHDISKTVKSFSKDNVKPLLRSVSRSATSTATTIQSNEGPSIQLVEGYLAIAETYILAIKEVCTHQKDLKYVTSLIDTVDQIMEEVEPYFENSIEAIEVYSMGCTTIYDLILYSNHLFDERSSSEYSVLHKNSLEKTTINLDRAILLLLRIYQSIPVEDRFVTYAGSTRRLALNIEQKLSYCLIQSVLMHLNLSSRNNEVLTVGMLRESQLSGLNAVDKYLLISKPSDLFIISDFEPPELFIAKSQLTKALGMSSIYPGRVSVLLNYCAVLRFYHTNVGQFLWSYDLTPSEDECLKALTPELSRIKSELESHLQHFISNYDYVSALKACEGMVKVAGVRDVASSVKAILLYQSLTSRSALSDLALRLLPQRSEVSCFWRTIQREFDYPTIPYPVNTQLQANILKLRYLSPGWRRLDINSDPLTILGSLAKGSYILSLQFNPDWSFLFIASGRCDDVSAWNVQKIDIDGDFRREILTLLDRHHRWRAEVQRFNVTHPSILRSMSHDSSHQVNNMSVDTDEVDDDMLARFETVEAVER